MAGANGGVGGKEGLEREALKVKARASGGYEMLKRSKGFKDGSHGGKRKKRDGGGSLLYNLMA